MSNNKRKFNRSPKLIDNYNKFLITLDNSAKKETLLDNVEQNKQQDEIEKIFENIHKQDESIKSEIEKLIEDIHKNFNLNNLSSTNFTGQTNNDVVLSFLDKNDPNLYIDHLNKNLNSNNCIRRFVKEPQTSIIDEKVNGEIKIKKEQEIQKFVDISVEINNISDLLKLIDSYKIEPSVKYNINMQALHNIKEPLEELNNMIGMEDLKNNMVDQILYFVQELHKNKDLTGEFLHTVIYGPPGTGKTEIAKIMGKIYSKIGILSRGTFKKVTRSDLVAGYLGQTALKTQDVIKESLGGVLFIDEAYSLGNSEKRDSFSKECIDTLCESLSNNKENLMVIIAGYEKELKECFFSLNQGLNSRFTWRFKIDDYTHEDLHKIFLKKMQDIGWEIDNSLNISITSEWFKKNKNYFQFYGRDIETLLSKTKIAHSRRVFCRCESEKKKITIEDLDKGFEIYLKNDEIKNNKEEEEKRRYIYNTLYS